VAGEAVSDDSGPDALGGLVIVGIICVIFPPAIFGFIAIFGFGLIFSAVLSALPNGDPDE